MCRWDVWNWLYWWKHMGSHDNWLNLQKSFGEWSNCADFTGVDWISAKCCNSWRDWVRDLIINTVSLTLFSISKSFIPCKCIDSCAAVTGINPWGLMLLCCWQSQWKEHRDIDWMIKMLPIKQVWLYWKTITISNYCIFSVDLSFFFHYQ